MVTQQRSSEPVRVDFDFRREVAQKLDGNLAAYCYQCGACVGDCPSATYGERFNPRAIMLSVLYGLGDELLSEDSVLWDCTNCYNCQERCPQEVKPVEVIIALKNMLADRGRAPSVVGRILGSFRESGRTTPVSKAVERKREALGLPPLAELPTEELTRLLEPLSEAESAAAAPAQEAPVAAPSRSSTGAEGTKRFAFFPGCLIPTRHPAMEFAIRETLPPLGLELVDLEGASCCPDPIYFKSHDKLSWLSIAARNLTLAEDLGLDVVTNCSGCTATLSEARHHLEDEPLREQVNRRLERIGRGYRGSTRVRHVATVLRDEVGYERLRASVVRPLEGLKVAIHYGCHLLKPSRIMAVDDPDDPSILEELVRALGATPVRHQNWCLCCGKACQTQDIHANMMRDLLSSVHHEEADVLCLICPTCFGQFDHGQHQIAQRFEEDFHTPAVYYFQLLAFAQGVPYEKLGFERQKFAPECLRPFAESVDQRTPRVVSQPSSTAPSGGSPSSSARS